MVRDMVLAWSFGNSGIMSAFVVASRIPNLFRDMLAEGALGGAFTKVYASLHHKDPERADQMLRDMLHLALVGSAVFCAVGILLAPHFVDLMNILSPPTPGAQTMRDNVVFLTRLSFPYLGLTIVGAIVAGALHQHNRFFLTAVSPIALNIGYVVGATLIAQLLTLSLPESFDTAFANRAVTGLTIGVLLGGYAHLMVQVRGLHQLGLKQLFAPPWQKFWTDDTKNVLRIMLPATVAASTGPVNLLINTNFANSVSDQAVSSLYYAFHVLHLPVGVFGVAIGSAALPALSRTVGKNHGQINAEIAKQLQSAMELVLWFMVPSFAFLFIAARPTIALLYQHGEFNAQSTIDVADALQAYSFSLFGYGLLKVLTSFYYASERTRFAMKTGIISVVLNFVGCWFLVGRYGHVGLALTSSITICANALFLLFGLIPQKPPFDWKGVAQMLSFLGFGLGLSLLLCKGLEYSSLISVMASPLPHKFVALAQVLANGLIITGVFFMLAVWRFEMTPQQLLQRLRKRR